MRWLFPLGSVLSSGSEPLLLALSVCVKVLFAQVFVVVVPVQTIETHLSGLLARIVVLARALDGKHQFVHA